MFLPPKAHTREIVDGQFKVRLGSRVPKDAVNLAYTHIPPVKADNNVLITDLSNAILENNRNTTAVDVVTYPDSSLVLQLEDGQTELPTEDIYITNFFEKGVPLYYAYKLAYKHYDQKGPDEFGVYRRDGISIIDQLGNPVKEPYQIHLVADPNNANVYDVIIYTSFKDEIGKTYTVIYNAISFESNGRMITKAGHQEPLNVLRSFKRVSNIGEILKMVKEGRVEPAYYQANGSVPGTSKIYVPSPHIKDTREYQRFHYQIGLEIKTAEGTKAYTTPWYIDQVINPMYLNGEEAEEYENGYKQLTKLTAEEMMHDFVPKEAYADRKALFRYFVRIDNPKVEEFFRTDGSSPIYATTMVEDERNVLKVPASAKKIDVPVTISTNVECVARPTRANPLDAAYVTFVMDNSESMITNDPNKALRLQIMDGLIKNCTDFFARNGMNGMFFNDKVWQFQSNWKKGDKEIVEAYSKTMKDFDITRPLVALDKMIADYKPVANSNGSNKNWKIAIMITDGQFFEKKTLEDKFIEAKKNNIILNVICFNKYDEMKALCDKYGGICLNAKSPRILMDIQYFFFNILGIHSSTLIKSIPVKMSPLDNDKLIIEVTKDTFQVPDWIRKLDDRYGIEFRTPKPIDTLSFYIIQKDTGTPLGSYQGATLIPMKDVFKNKTYKVMMHSIAWEHYYANSYSLQFNDTRRMYIEKPRQQLETQSWYLRIKNGRFDKQIQDKSLGNPIHTYAIPEYYRQNFIKGSMPYMQVRNEKPELLNTNKIRVSCTPLVVTFNGEYATNVSLRINGKPVRVTSWDSSDGIMTIDGHVTDNDNMLIDYQFEESFYEYRGFYDIETDKFWSLDLNPSSGHYITIRDPADGEVKDLPSFKLIDKTIYIYVKPAAKITKMINGEFRLLEPVRPNTIFHSFELIEGTEAMLLGEVRVRPSSNQRSIQIVDTRVRGGGLKPEITEEIMGMFEKESHFYWDIGYWDGKPFPENAVINIKIAKSVLKEYGGHMTRAEVEDKLEKHLGYGVFPIIEFMDDPDSLLQIPDGLVVEVIEVDEQTTDIEKPTFRLGLEG